MTITALAADNTGIRNTNNESGIQLTTSLMPISLFHKTPGINVNSSVLRLLALHCQNRKSMISY